MVVFKSFTCQWILLILLQKFQLGLANEINKYVFYLVFAISVRIKMNNFWFLLSEEFVCLDRKKMIIKNLYG